MKTLLFFLLFLSLFSCKTKEIIINLPAHPSVSYDHRPVSSFGVIEVKVLDVLLLPDSIFIDCSDSTTISSPQIPHNDGVGISEFYKQVFYYIRYPEAALDNGIQGRVIASFVVRRDNEFMSDIEIVRYLDKSLDEEVLRVLNCHVKNYKWFWHPTEGNEKKNESAKFFVEFRFIIK